MGAVCRVLPYSLPSFQSLLKKRGAGMAEHSFPLFEWDPPAKVVAFPLSRRLAKIRRVADLLDKRQGSEADSYWKTTVRGLADQLARAGVPADDINRELLEFQEAVQAELRRRFTSWEPGDCA
jgi:hypothetical protein